MVGIIAVGIGLTFRVCPWLIAAARKGWTEELIMRMSDFTFAFPAVPRPSCWRPSQVRAW
jgi:peptide/nickel transport system permease protein